jgi:hypothetical protein
MRGLCTYPAHPAGFLEPDTPCSLTRSLRTHSPASLLSHASHTG